ncbi:MAG: glycosyltransferase family 4 protein [Actinobacteria bacterium]|nr:glycosyltransferase family 4 protein [Actinomycetota bacterium]
MKKIALVVQRCHKSVVGGSESEAWHYANLLKEYFEVHLLTTTAVDTDKWESVLPEGDEFKDGICIKRFKVSQGRADYWIEFYGRLVNEFENTRLNNPDLKAGERLIKWPLALQEEFIYKQGPYSSSLMDFLNRESINYKAIIFFTYLYPTTYFGMYNAPKNKIIFVPTLHNEAPAYLSAYKYMAKRARNILWNTMAESRLGISLWGDQPKSIVGMGVEVKKFIPANTGFPYLLYCGRIDVNKGCPQLVDYFLKYKKDNPSDLRLVFTGIDGIGLPSDSNILFKGFVSESEKLKLMSGASVFIMPSSNESFSIVTLEAMAQNTPVLASNGSEVIIDHIRRSGGGLLYSDYESFEEGIKFLLEDKDEVRRMGEKGRKYVVENYDNKKISIKLKDLLNNIE